MLLFVCALLLCPCEFADPNTVENPNKGTADGRDAESPTEGRLGYHFRGPTLMSAIRTRSALTAKEEERFRPGRSVRTRAGRMGESHAGTEEPPRRLPRNLR